MNDNLNYEVVCEADSETGETMEVRLFSDGHVEIVNVPKETSENVVFD